MTTAPSEVPLPEPAIPAVNPGPFQTCQAFYTAKQIREFAAAQVSAALAAQEAEVQRLRALVTDYCEANDAAWRETCEKAARAGVSAVEVSPTQAAAMDKFHAMRAAIRAGSTKT